MTTIHHATTDQAPRIFIDRQARRIHNRPSDLEKFLEGQTTNVFQTGARGSCGGSVSYGGLVTKDPSVATCKRCLKKLAKSAKDTKPTKTRETLPAVKTEAELNERLSSLPDFSRRVYDAIQGTMYAEPGFSDVTFEDIVHELGCSAAQTRGAITKLTAMGLIYSSDDSSLGSFFHTYEHDDELRDEDTGAEESAEDTTDEDASETVSEGQAARKVATQSAEDIREALALAREALAAATDAEVRAREAREKALATVQTLEALATTWGAISRA